MTSSGGSLYRGLAASLSVVYQPYAGGRLNMSPLLTYQSLLTAMTFIIAACPMETQPASLTASISAYGNTVHTDTYFTSLLYFFS